MISLQKNEPPLANKHIPGAALLLSIASAKFGVVVLGILAVVLIPATLLDKYYGLDFANWYVYKSSWFIALLFLLCANLLAAVLVRIPRSIGGVTAFVVSAVVLFLAAYYGDSLSSWFGRSYNRPWFILSAFCVTVALLAATLWNRLLGFFMAHGGVLVLLLGAYQTFSSGIDGQLSLVEGETANRIRIADQEIFSVSREARAESNSPPSADFIFSPGPVDWPDGKTLEWPEESQGVRLKLLKYYRHARIQEEWIPAPGKEGEPALRFAILHADGKTMWESWLAGEPLGGTGLQLRILPAPVDSMREDFLNPPAKEEDEKGVLSIHYDGRMLRIPVSKNLGKKFALEGSKIEVEITRYYANAKPVGTVQFESQGDEPKKPLLDLNIYLPDGKEPQREIAFARIPLLSIFSAHGRDCPVKFWYHQPAMAVPGGVDFLRTPDGKLYCRAGIDGKYVSRGEVRAGSSIEIVEKLQLKILEYLPFARHKVVPQPVESADDEQNLPGPAALVEAASGGARQTCWLVRDDQKYSSQIISTPKENLTIHFDYNDAPLGFSLKLVKFTRVLNPGRMGDAAFISSVQVIDKAREINEQREITMNQPLTFGKFTIYQSGCNELEDGRKVSTLSAAYDPGRFLKYLGCLMICGGMALRYMTTFRFYKSLRQNLFRTESSV
jgi:hypothetical protein